MSSAKKPYRIAVIAGDGIGKEVMVEGLRVIEQAAKKHQVAVEFDHFDFASYDYYAKHGQMMPDDWKEKIGKHDAIYFGAVGWPAKIPEDGAHCGSPAGIQVLLKINRNGLLLRVLTVKRHDHVATQRSAC